MKNMFPLCQTYKPTGARGLTSHMSSLANEVKTVCLRDENNWFPHWQYHHIYARYRPRVYYVVEKTVLNGRLPFHDNMSPVQRIIATRVKQKCICSGKLEALITAAGDHWHCSRIWQSCPRAPNFQKVDQHTGGKWLIRSTQRRKYTRSRSLELPCKISYIGT